MKTVSRVLWLTIRYHRALGAVLRLLDVIARGGPYDKARKSELMAHFWVVVGSVEGSADDGAR